MNDRGITAGSTDIREISPWCLFASKVLILEYKLALNAEAFFLQEGYFTTETSIAGLIWSYHHDGPTFGVLRKRMYNNLMGNATF